MASILPGRRTAISIPSEKPKEATQPCLLIISGPEMGRRIELGTEPVTIGRADTCDICVAADQVSRSHATVQRALGRYYLLDLRSTNGTFINEQRIERAQLRDGDQIRIGKAVIKYTESPVEQQYFEHVFNLASLDSLTGAFNKRYFDETFSKQIQRADPKRHPLSLVLFDIDHFKKINDGFGHAAGDAVLKSVATTVAAELREGDSLYRVGGEEFALVLADTALAQGLEAAEAVRALIERSPTDFTGTHISASLSLGVAEFASGEAPLEVYQRADEQLYAAKRGGRNRVAG